ncbi:MAG TPA: trehalose-phosphatase, partial [Bryobacteraceae bacterium]|nr:trehalose-phosphatase [Bryobacteraceae bacterium]
MTHCLQAFSEIDAALSGARRILIASDFDGTLCAIEDTPAKVRLTARMLAILRSIVACERLELAVISGRSLEELTQLVPLDIPLAGNHGLEISGPRLSFVHAAALGLRPKLRSACDALTREL